MARIAPRPADTRGRGRRIADTDSRDRRPATSSSPSAARRPTATCSPRPPSNGAAPGRRAGARRRRAQIVVDDVVTRSAPSPPRSSARARSRRLRIVGITGSNGKTTTKNLLRAVLERGRATVSPRSSFNNEVGAPLTMLASTRRHAVPRRRDGRERRRRDRPPHPDGKPDVGVVLKVGLAHAGEFGGIEATRGEDRDGERPPGRGASPCSTSTIRGRRDGRHAGPRRVVRTRTAPPSSDRHRSTACGTTFTLHLPDGSACARVQSGARRAPRHERPRCGAAAPGSGVASTSSRHRGARRGALAHGAEPGATV